LLPFLNNVCEIKAITFTQNGAELLGIRKASRTCGSERPTDRPQRILVPGRGNAYGSVLFTHNGCRAGLVFRMKRTSAERHILQAGTTNELREACKTAAQHS